MRRLPVYRGPVPQSHPNFPDGSDAATTKENMPVDIQHPKIVYTSADDAAIDEYHRRTGKCLRAAISLNQSFSLTGYSGDYLALGKISLLARLFV